VLGIGDVASACRHLDTIREVTPSSLEGCSQCLASGGRWVHLRVCLACGEVGCCDSSPNRHASRHAAEHGHPLVASLEPDEDWAWCYVDQVALAVQGLDLPRRRPYPGERGHAGERE
jgi:uncharacterized UBP type Zn finger protein